MMFHRLAAAKEGQRGFTLVELLVVIAITGLIGSVVVGAIYQVFTVSARNTSRMTIVKQLENAVRWITPDAQMAQNVSGDLTGSAGLSLTWVERDLTADNVTYRIQDGQLERSYYRDSVLQSTKVVARNIDAAQTSSSFANGTIAFTVTSAIGGYKPESVTRSFNVTLRSS
jgi:prepilin-type N-terminal cleavage/methylation domain-containing protein